jgi:hypothetical protein
MISDSTFRLSVQSFLMDSSIIDIPIEEVVLYRNTARVKEPKLDKKKVFSDTEVAVIDYGKIAACSCKETPCFRHRKEHPYNLGAILSTLSKDDIQRITTDELYKYEKILAIRFTSLVKALTAPNLNSKDVISKIVKTIKSLHHIAAKLFPSASEICRYSKEKRGSLGFNFGEYLIPVNLLPLVLYSVPYYIQINGLQSFSPLITEMSERLYDPKYYRTNSHLVKTRDELVFVSEKLNYAISVIVTGLGIAITTEPPKDISISQEQVKEMIEDTTQKLTLAFQDTIKGVSETLFNEFNRQLTGLKASHKQKIKKLKTEILTTNKRLLQLEESQKDNRPAKRSKITHKKKSLNS